MCCPGGRLTEEDAYAYSKFARLALGTNDIDYRSRPASAEELTFLAAHVAGVGAEHVSYRTIDEASSVLLVGLEPEEESPILFLRLRKTVRNKGIPVWSIASHASHGLEKLDGTLIQTVPGGEASAVDLLDGTVTRALFRPGALILVGERLATVPGAYSTVAALAARTGAKLAWVPRRAGERGALDAGAVPNLLPGARSVTDARARADVAAVWGAEPPAQPGRDVDAIIQAAAEGSLPALVVGGVDPADFADPALVETALRTAGFVVSLEVRRSLVTEYADVVLPVAPPAEKAGRYVTWEGRRRPFDLTITGTGAISDASALDALADELDVFLGLRAVESAREELRRLGVTTARVNTPTTPARGALRPEAGQAVLATWAELLDAGRGQDGDEHLAGTAKPVRVLLNAATAAANNVSAGQDVAVSTERGAIVAPVELADLPDGVVWLPTNARGGAVRATLGAVHGSLVTLTDPSAPPVVGGAE